MLAYNFDEKEDFTGPEYNLFLGLAYAYEWYRTNPDDKEDCEKLMKNYIEFYEMTKEQNWMKINRD